MQHPEDFFCGRLLGVHYHGQIKHAAKESQRILIFRIADSGDGGTAAGSFGQQTAQQIDFVVACHRNEQIGLFHSSLQKCVMTDGNANAA